MDDCIEFTGYRDTQGYGQYQAKPLRGKKAHRVAWERAHGPIPDGMCICHRCDNRACINLDHLFLGTNADNTRDRDIKHRRHVKLTPDQVREIRAAPHYDGIQDDLARQYGCNQSNISRIRTRKAWHYI